MVFDVLPFDQFVKTIGLVLESFFFKCVANDAKKNHDRREALLAIYDPKFSLAKRVHDHRADEIIIRTRYDDVIPKVRDIFTVPRVWPLKPGDYVITGCKQIADTYVA